MELDDGERYAAAALFTLALHTTQVEAGVDEAGNRLGAFKSAWGCPDEELFDDVICVPEDEPWPGMEVPSGFWGFDCCAPRGLCRRVYRALGIVEARWPGLIKMPDVSNAAKPHDAQVALVRLVRRYGALLDPTVAPLVRRAVSVEPPGEGGEVGSWGGDSGDGGGGCGDAGAAAANGVGTLAGIGGGGVEPGEGGKEEEEEEEGAQQQFPGEPPGTLGTAEAEAEAAAAEGRSQAVGGPAVLRRERGQGRGVVAGSPEPRQLPTSGEWCIGAGGPSTEEPQQLPLRPLPGAQHLERLQNELPLPPPPQQQQQQQQRHRIGKLGLEEAGEAATRAPAAAISRGNGSERGEEWGGAVGASPAAFEAAAAAAGPATAQVTGSIGTGAASATAAGCCRAAPVAAGEEAAAAVGAEAAAVVASRVALQPLCTSGSGASWGGAVAAVRHDPTHQSVLALYELIGACLRAATAGDDDGDGAACGGGGEGGGGGEAEVATAAPEATGSCSGSVGTAAAGSGTAEQQQQPRALGSGFSFFGGRRPGGGGGGGATAAMGTGTATALAVPVPVRLVRRPLVRWYDARARVALRRFCHWLHIPAAKMHAMEQMWALQALQLRQCQEGDGGSGGGRGDGSGGSLGGAVAAAGGGGAAAAAWRSRRYVTYLKISAGALGGAALLALTGGLAAPAIAAGLGSAVAVFGGSTAAASATAATLGTAAGTAAISGTFGVIGASHAGAKAAALYGEVREFGFWSISAPFILPPPPSVANADPERCGGGADAGPSTSLTTVPCSVSSAAPGRWGSGLFRWRSVSANLPPSDSESGSRSGPEPGGSGGPRAEGAAAVPAPARSSLRPRRPEEEVGAAAGGPVGFEPPFPPLAPQLRPRLSLQPPSQQQQKRLQQAGGGLGLARQYTCSDGGRSAGGSSAGGAPPPPSLGAAAAPISARPSRSPSVLSHDGLLIPLDMMGGSDGGDGGSGGLGCGLAAHPLDPGSSSPSLSGTEGDFRGVSGGGRDPRAASSGGAPPSAAVAAAAVAPAPKPDDASTGGVSAAAARANPAAAGNGGSARSEDKQSHSGSSEVSSLSGEDDGDPWVSEIAATDRNTAAAEGRGARAGGSGAEGAYVDALLAELAAEAADLDGDGGGSRTPPVMSTAVEAAGGGGGARPPRWSSWFRSGGKQSGEAANRRRTTPPTQQHRAAGRLLPLLPLPVNPRRSGDATLALTIAVNGWVKKPEDFVAPWRHLPSSGRELWALVWDSDVLQSLGGALGRFIRDKALEESGKMVLRLGVSSALVTAMMLPMAVMSAINLTIGSRWRVALRRAQLGGRCLAHMLMQGGHGDRPVTLIGFSIGARLIFHCLLELSRCGARGLVESAVLLGTPVSSTPGRWAAARAAVSGRLVNAFSANDWVLGVVFRAHSRQTLLAGPGLGAAGLGPVAVGGVENLNLSALVAGHTQYLEKLPEVLSALNLAEH